MTGPTEPLAASTFTGALLPVCGVEVLIVAVQPWILADADEAQLYVVAFGLRFQRTVVLAAQDPQRVPTYYGPAAIARALCALPFELIPWRRIRYRHRPRDAWRLPTPPEPPPTDSDACAASRAAPSPPRRRSAPGSASGARTVNARPR